jgi:hypothetical protein
LLRSRFEPGVFQVQWKSVTAGDQIGDLVRHHDHADTSIGTRIQTLSSIMF